LSEDWWPRWFRKGRWPLFGGFGDIDDIFREMEETMKREFGELAKKAPSELIREQTLPNGTKVKRWGPFVYGYSVTIGPDGKPQVREFGNVKPETRLGRPSIGISEKREPLVDIMETDDEVRIIAELPGVEKESIRLHATENSIAISVDTPQRKYNKEIELKANVNPKQAKSSYKNGVLEVILKKKEKEKQKGELINVE
jgi:HSP20 family protein